MELGLMEKTACFTGHRPQKLGGFDEMNPVMFEVRIELEKHIYRAIKLGYRRFISGMALGVDQVAADIVLGIKSERNDIELIAAVPFEGQQSIWPAYAQKQWSDIIERCDTVKYVNNPGFKPWKMQARNKWMVDQSKLLIAVWDGTDGGTANCVQYAMKAEHQPDIWQIKPIYSVA